MACLSVPVLEKVWERESDEIYIISNKNDINYLQAIKRVIGMSDKPLANE
jgi:hypothetical protein